jgi:putative ABC transport system permease protein
MMSVALKMLFGDRAKYFGIVMGVTLASMVITQQGAIFIGIMTRTYGTVTDTGQGDIWVMDPKVQQIEDIKPMQDTELFRVRGIQGVGWALPLYKGLIRARLDNGQFQNCNILGLDDATLTGGPPGMAQGSLSDLRRADAIIVDEISANTRLAKPSPEPGGRPIPLKVGDTLELNDHRAVVVGIGRSTRTFQSLPVIHTTYGRATTFVPKERKLLSFVLVKAAPGVDVESLRRRIELTTGLAALTNQQFKDKTVDYFIKNTGIPINIGIGMVMSFIVGTAIAGFRRSTASRSTTCGYFGSAQGDGRVGRRAAVHGHPAVAGGGRDRLRPWDRHRLVLRGEDGEYAPGVHDALAVARHRRHRGRHHLRPVGDAQHPQGDLAGARGCFQAVAPAA